MRKNIAFIAVIIFSLNFNCSNNPKTFEIGENEIVILEFLQTEKVSVQGLSQPILDQPGK